MTPSRRATLKLGATDALAEPADAFVPLRRWLLEAPADVLYAAAMRVGAQSATPTPARSSTRSGCERR